MARMVARGDTGSTVLNVQRKLNVLGYNVDEDGVFGRNTKAAVRHFQSEVGLDTDGIVGEETHGALDELLADEWVVEEWDIEEWYVDGEEDDDLEGRDTDDVDRSDDEEEEEEELV